MSLDVKLTPKASKHFDRLERKYQERISLALLALQKDPTIGKSLLGKYHGIQSYRVWPYRILYMFFPKQQCIIIVDIIHRQGAYN